MFYDKKYKLPLPSLVIRSVQIVENRPEIRFHSFLKFDLYLINNHNYLRQFSIAIESNFVPHAGVSIVENE